MTLDLQQVARVMGAAGDPRAVRVGGWSVDTRTQQPGDVYFALRGPNHDGHDFARASAEQGASAVVLERTVGAPNELLVNDTLAALQQLGAWARENWKGALVGVTGSAGKTTTKDAIAHLLSAALPVGKTVGNFNNHVGVPLSILRLPDGCRAAVLEMGMNHAGEIRALARDRQAAGWSRDQRRLRPHRVLRFDRRRCRGQARADRGAAARWRRGPQCRRPARARASATRIPGVP